MSKKDRRKELEEQKASEGKVVVLKEKEEKKEVAEVVKTAAKKVEPKELKKGDSADTMTIDGLAEWSSKQNKIIQGLCANLKKQSDRISEHDERIAALEEEVSEIKGYFEEEDEEVEEEQQDQAELVKSEEENPIQLCFDPNGTQNGPGYAYKYWDATTGTYGITRDIFAAKQISNGAYDPIWVCYKDGKIDHILSIDELRKYAPK